MRGRSILICDDEAELAEELGEFFEGLGWTVKVCIGGIAARQELLDGFVPDCLLTDLNMSDLCGSELIAFARGLPKKAQPRLIAVMTGNDVMQRNFDELGCDLLFFKPIDPVAVAGDIEHRVGPPPLPVPPQPVVARPEISQAKMAPFLQRQAVLVLEDDPVLREELCEMLVAAGHWAWSAEDGSSLDATSFDGVDVIVVDLWMPTVDGMDILHRLGHLPSAPAIIIISGHGEAVLRAVTCAAEGEGLRILGALPKPLDMTHMLSLIENLERPVSEEEEARSSDGLAPALVELLDSRALSIVFQPIVAADRLRFAGAEALLPDHLPGFGPVSPPEVIAAAAAVPGLLVRLTHEIMRLAAEACAAWTKAGWNGTVSVNVPLETLLAEDAVATIRGIVQKAGLKPEQMFLELTEDSIYETSALALAKLRLAGFGLALDDVGRRQSGLLQLANLPVNEIKIDLEIVRQARSWAKFRSIFGSIAELGNSLDVIVVAEGIETLDDLALARHYKVDYIQGYLISRKRSLPELLNLLPHLDQAVASIS